MTLMCDSGAGFVALQLSLERVVVVVFPFRAYALTTKRSASICVLVLIALAGLE